MPSTRLEVDGHVVAGGRVRPAGLEELLARRDEVVGPGADALGVGEHDDRAASGRTSSTDSMPSTSAGASDSMPSTAMPSATLASMSATPGSCVGERGRARARTSSVSSSSRHGRGPEAVLGDLEAALVGDLEPADLLDGVAPELDADRVLLGRREDVEDAAAHGELAAPLDEVGARVGRAGERVDDVLERRARRRLAARPGTRSPSPWRWAAGRARTGCDDDRQRAVCRVVGVGVGEPPQHGQSPADRVAARAEALVREGLPAREDRRRRRAAGRPRGPRPGRRPHASWPSRPRPARRRRSARARAATRNGRAAVAARHVDELGPPHLLEHPTRGGLGLPGVEESGQMSRSAGGGCGHEQTSQHFRRRSTGRWTRRQHDEPTSIGHGCPPRVIAPQESDLSGQPHRAEGLRETGQVSPVVSEGSDLLGMPRPDDATLPPARAPPALVRRPTLGVGVTVAGAQLRGVDRLTETEECLHALQLVVPGSGSGVRSAPRAADRGGVRRRPGPCERPASAPPSG